MKELMNYDGIYDINPPLKRDLSLDKPKGW